MIALIARRVLGALPNLFGIVVITFLLTRALPGDPAAFYAGPAGTQAAVEEVREKLGLNRSMPEQFAIYLNDLCPLYTSYASDEKKGVDLGGSRQFEKKNNRQHR